MGDVHRNILISRSFFAIDIFAHMLWMQTLRFCLFVVLFWKFQKFQRFVVSFWSFLLFACLCFLLFLFGESETWRWISPGEKKKNQHYGIFTICSAYHTLFLFLSQWYRNNSAEIYLPLETIVFIVWNIQKQLEIHGCISF